QTLPIFVVASTTGSSFFKIAVSGSTTLSTLGTGIVRSVGGELNIGAIVLSSASDVSGTLGIINGGTGTTTAGSAGTVAYYDGSTLRSTFAGTTGQLLQSNGSGAPTFVSTSTLGLGSVNDINNVSTGTAGNIFNISTTTNSL